MRILASMLTLTGWACWLAWLVALCSGGARNVIDYANASVETPLILGQPLQFSDQKHAMWSGWWSADAGGFRFSTSNSPDILFRQDKPGSSCALSVQAFPKLAPEQVSQPIYAKLNDAPLVGPVELSTGGVFRLEDVGSTVEGINVLTFWLPGARRINDRDERRLALALRSLSISCREAAEADSARSGR